MIRSMTGFGQAEATADNWQVKVEVKTVNHRYLDMALRFSHAYAQLEAEVRKLVKSSFARGRVEISIILEELGEKPRMVQVDKSLLRGYLSALAEIQQELGTDQSIDLAHILGFSEVFSVVDNQIDTDRLCRAVLPVVERALEQVKQMRQQEGAQLFADITYKLDRVEHLMERIDREAPTVVERYRRRLEERMSEFLDEPELFCDRITAEAAIFADKCSIDEEVVRFRSHLEQFRQSLQQDEPVGRKLDFLLQELNRETNTIAAKANDSTIAGFTVELKSEIEKLREQVQNIE